MYKNKKLIAWKILNRQTRKALRKIVTKILRHNMYEVSALKADISHEG